VQAVERGSKTQYNIDAGVLPATARTREAAGRAKKAAIYPVAAPIELFKA